MHRRAFYETGLVVMDEYHCVQALRAKLDAARLATIEEMAASSDAPTLDGMQKLAFIQSALTAMVGEMEPHR